MNLIMTLQASSASSLFQMLPILLMFVIIYFFFIRPTANKQKAQSLFVDNIKKGDEVVTTSGLIGKIDAVKGDEISLQVDSKTYLRFTKGAVSKELTEEFHKVKTT